MYNLPVISKPSFHHYWCSRNIFINVGRIVLLDILVKLFFRILSVVDLYEKEILSNTSLLILLNNLMHH